MTTSPSPTPPASQPLTLAACRDLLARGRTKLRVRAGHGEAGREVTMYRIGATVDGPVVWGTYEVYSIARGGAGRSDQHVGYWKAEDLEIRED
jgi:hypothetical protein